MALKGYMKLLFYGILRDPEKSFLLEGFPAFPLCFSEKGNM
jgi:hypothetical protein